MKKRIIILIVLVVILAPLIYFNTGHTMGAKTPEYTSEIYTDKEIEAAIRVAKRHFRKHFADCTMWEIRYAGDEQSLGESQIAKHHGGDEAIEFKMDFTVGKFGTRGGLAAGHNHIDFGIILTRKNGGRWFYADGGYG